MKQNYLFLLCLLTLLLPTSLLSQWVTLNTNTSDGFFNIEVVDDQVAFGFGRTVVKTTDGGISWNPLVTNTISSWINTGFFVDAQTGWIGGKYGLQGGEILKTTDGGATWVSQDTINDIGFNDFHFLDAQTGWAVTFGGTLLKTVDGGDNWTTAYDFQEEIEKLQFTSAQVGWAISYGGTLYQSLDGGSSWTQKQTDWGYGLYFLNSDQGWATGKDGEMYHTADGGASWFQQNTSYNKPLTSVHFADALNGWAVGGVDCRFGGCVPFQKVIATTDGGLSWFSQTHNGDLNPQFNSVGFGNSAAFIGGEDGQIIKLQTALTPGEGSTIEVDFTLYPNPAKGPVHVDIPQTIGQGNLRVYAANGQLVYTIDDCSGIIPLKSSTWAPGIYFVQFRNAQFNASKRLIIQ